MEPMSINEQMSGGVPKWTITDRLRKAREAAGLSQKELAAKATIGLRTVSNYENPDYTGERKRPFVVAWGLATGWSVEWLWDGTQPKQTGPDDTGGQEIMPTRWYEAEIIDLGARRDAAAAEAA